MPFAISHMFNYVLTKKISIRMILLASLMLPDPIFKVSFIDYRLQVPLGSLIDKYHPGDREVCQS